MVISRKERRSVKSIKLIGMILLLSLLLSGCANEVLPSTESTDEVSPDYLDPMQLRILQRCREITGLYYDLYENAVNTATLDQWGDPVLSQDSIDAIESLLIEEGMDVMDTKDSCPCHLTTAESFYAFRDAVNRRETAEQEVIQIRESGDLSYRLFTCRDGIIQVYSVLYPSDSSSGYHYEKHEVLDWELTDRGNFYYRVYPAGDKHYADYALIRLNAPDQDLCAKNRTYIGAGGYIGANIFLTDWTEADFGKLCINDIWEYLFYDRNGTQFLPEGYAYDLERHCYLIPAQEFESVILPYFDIDLETFRNLAHYDPAGDCYPWCQIQTNDFAFLSFYMVEPEVTACRENPDGTLTLTVEMLSTDLKTDCLFAHELTVRPLENGEFQFVGNQVIYQTEYGLPYCEPRLTWDDL